MSKLGDEPAYPTDFNAIAYSAGDGPLELTIPDPGPPGCTKRELFAAMAMQGLEAGLGIDSRRFELMVVIAKSERITMAEVVALECVVTADALLAELAKEPEDAESACG